MATRNYYNETGKLIRSYADQGYSFKEICSLTGFASSTVSCYTRGFGYKWQESHADIAELRRSGCSIHEICLITGKHRKIVSSKCRDIGLRATEEELKETIELDKERKTHSEEWVKSYILDKSFGTFEYAGGYVNMDSHCLMRCVKCGQVEDRSMISLRSGKRVRCLSCQKKETEERRQKEREKKLIENEQARLTAKLIKAGNGKQLSFGFCACGEMLNHFIGYKGKQCNTCAKKAANKHKELVRRCKISNALVDSDITLPKLYQKENGICYLCGGLCNWNDKEVRENTIICGNQYPSIDHVIPLAKGGLHSWDNIRLAHRICNSLKSDNYDKGTMEKTNN